MEKQKAKNECELKTNNTICSMYSAHNIEMLCVCVCAHINRNELIVTYRIIN